MLTRRKLFTLTAAAVVATSLPTDPLEPFREQVRRMIRRRHPDPSNVKWIRASTYEVALLPDGRQYFRLVGPAS